MKVEGALINYLAKKGYDPQFGARPLKRLIQKDVGNTLSQAILKGDFTKDKEYKLGLDKDKVALK